MDYHSEGPLMEMDHAHSPTGKKPTKPARRRVTVEMLPDVSLLKIFDLYLYGNSEAWHTLVHVCRKWRTVVFGSPRHLNVHLVCTARTPMRKTLEIWPPLPIFIRGWDHLNSDVDNIIAALEHNDRVRGIILYRVPRLQIEKVLATMQGPFPELTILEFLSESEAAPVIPKSFLGGYAPRLRTLSLTRIPFPVPVLRKLHLSATHLINLSLSNIPQSGYISPEAMVTCLSTLTSLQTLRLEFETPQPHPAQEIRRPPPQTRTHLPALTWSEFGGVSEYLEDLVARIDAPLFYLRITFFHQLIFDTPQLAQFISRTPTLKVRDGAHVSFSNLGVSVALLSSPWTHPVEGLILRTSCKQSDWQLPSLAELCKSSLPPRVISSLDQLFIRENKQLQLHWQDDIECSQWLELLRAFTAVKDLYLSQEFAPRIAPALQELVEGRATEVLPALQNLFLEEPQQSGPVKEAVGQFVAARQLSGHPISVFPWDRKNDEWWNPNG